MKTRQIAMFSGDMSKIYKLMTKFPQKKNQTSFAVDSGVEPKGNQVGFRPTIGLEKQMKAAIAKSGLTTGEWMRRAVEFFLEKSPQDGGNNLEQGELDGTGRISRLEPANLTGDLVQPPACRDATGRIDQTLSSQPDIESKRRPASRTKT